MKTDRYLVLRADDATCIYRSTVIELVRRGYKFSRAKDMVRASGIIEDAKRYWAMVRDFDECDWADYALEQLALLPEFQKEIQQAGGRIVKERLYEFPA